MTLTTQIGDYSAIDIFASLKITYAAVDITVEADGKYIYIRFPSIRAAIFTYKSLRGKIGSADFLTAVNATLRAAEITVCIQNRYFAILGTKANPFLLKFFMSLRKPTDIVH